MGKRSERSEKMTGTKKKTQIMKIPMILAGALAVSSIALMLWGSSLMKEREAAQQVPPEETTQATQQTQATEPPETQPPTAEDIVAAFAAQNGLTLADWPEKLIQLLERNPETKSFVLNYPMAYGKEHTIDISGHAEDEGVPLFIQWDPQWGYKDYVGNIAGLSGCGPTCLSMVVYHFTRDPQMHPAYMMEFAESDPRYANEGAATQWALFTEGAEKLGLSVKELTSEQIASEEKLARVLDSGRVIVANVGPGVFTEIGHYLLVVGYEDGMFRINDPNSRTNSQKLWKFEEFADQIKMMWSYDM